MFVSANATQLTEETAKQTKHALLWGDPVEIIDELDATTARARAHGKQGLVKRKDLRVTDPELLELYVIDVGQGDAILIRTPDDKWHLVDGGPGAGDSLLGKNARSFLAWKFAIELGRTVAALETVVLTHADEDHFAGLTEILRGSFAPAGQPSTLTITAERVLHAGVAKYKTGDVLGVANGRIPAARLLADHASFATPPAPLAQEFGKFAAAVAALKTAAGDPTPARRVRRGDTVDGYGPGAAVEMQVLGPKPENQAGDLKSFGSSSFTVNGHSVVLRLDYGNARILLTGDLNAKAQKHLLAGNADPTEFACDVVKACHHGSDDIDETFIATVGPRATVVSSGDAETYSHPRPIAIGAYAFNGRRSVTSKKVSQPPMVYSTEVARSIKTKGALITDVVFGLVNIRTDGKRILCATRNEINDSFDVEEFVAGQ